MPRIRPSRKKNRIKASGTVHDNALSPDSDEPARLANQDEKFIEIGKAITIEASFKPKRQGKKTFHQFIEQVNALLEDQVFYIFRTDNNQILARDIEGFENAKRTATNLRRKHGLQWDQVRFKAQRSAQSKQFGVSGDGRTFTNAYGQQSRVEYSRRYNPSKGRRFRGYTDAEGNYHDID
jgi:hypothetical protein